MASKTSTFDIAVTEDADGITVTATWPESENLDRVDAYAWGLGKGHHKLADRLVAAINDGHVLVAEEEYVDTSGNRGRHVRSTILSRMMNAELRRLGY